MLLNLENFSSSKIYHLLTQAIIPRPIAWVVSENADASLNLAPFSFFTAISSEPPLIMLSVGLKPDGSEKDTRVNIVERKHFVVNIPSVDDCDQLSDSSATLASGVSELTEFGIETCLPDGWTIPRVAAAPLALECELFKTELITEKQLLIFGLVKSVYINDEIAELDEKQRLSIDAEKLQPLARLGANEYASLGQIIEKIRPA